MKGEASRNESAGCSSLLKKPMNETTTTDEMNSSSITLVIFLPGRTLVATISGMNSVGSLCSRSCLNA